MSRKKPNCTRTLVLAEKAYLAKKIPLYWEIPSIVTEAARELFIGGGLKIIILITIKKFVTQNFEDPQIMKKFRKIKNSRKNIKKLKYFNKNYQ